MTKLIVGVQKKRAASAKEKVERELGALTSQKSVKVMETAKQPVISNPSLQAKSRRRRAKVNTN
jgi:hypothetical protein